MIWVPGIVNLKGEVALVEGRCIKFGSGCKLEVLVWQLVGAAE